MKFKNLPLLAKFYVSMVVLIILPLTLFSIFINYQFDHSASSRNYDQILQGLKQVHREIDAIMTNTSEISIRVLANDLIQDALRTDYDKTGSFGEDSWKIYTWLTDIISARPYYKSVGIYKNQTPLFQTGQHAPVLESGLVEHVYSLQGEGVWVHESDSIIYYRAIMDFNKLGRAIGIERFEIDESIFYDYYSDINNYDNSETFLLTSTGIIISSSNRSLVGTALEINSTAHSFLNRSTGFYLNNSAGIDQVVFVSSDGLSDWIFIQIIPKKSLATLEHTVNVVLLFVGLLFVLFAVIFPFVMHKYWIQPIRKLSKAIMRLKSGDFDISIENSSKDEIGEISQTFQAMTRQLKETIHEVYVTKIKQKEAEILALEAQINPHFLYNTLDSIRWQAINHQDYDVGEQIEVLAEMFRHVLSKGKEHVTIQEEINYLENYMFIQRKKYGSRVRMTINVESELLGVLVPKMLIQPLVENSIVHGFERIAEKGDICVDIRKLNDLIKIEIEDNGLGTDESLIHEKMADPTRRAEVLALKNIDDRIKTAYGNDYGIEFFSKQGQGTRVLIFLPMPDKIFDKVIV